MTTAKKTMLAIFAIGLVVAGVAGPTSAGMRVEAVYSSEPVDVRVWMDRGYGQDDWDAEDTFDYYDVYPAVDDVVLYIHAARNCYATVYVIDTEGFLHVVYPFSPFDNAYLPGGRVHRLYLRDYGFHRGCFGRGVAFAFAVTSPVPFGYANYGMTVFGPHVGFQVYGDPFVAARLFYLSILPRGCDPAFAVVSYARFYVTEYVRYPSYLCPGWHEHHGVRTYCGGECEAHRDYRIHAKDPFRVLRPAGTVDRETVRYTKIEPTGAKDFGDVRVRAPRTDEGRPAPVTVSKPNTAERRAARLGSGSSDRVVRSTRDEFVASKRNYEKMREVYQKTGDARGEAKSQPIAKSPTIVKSKVAKRGPDDARETATVSKRAANEARETVALRSAPSRETKAASKTGKDAKRTRS
jgi:hypothetical protein